MQGSLRYDGKKAVSVRKAVERTALLFKQMKKCSRLPVAAILCTRIRWGGPSPGCPVKIMFYLALVTIPLWRDSSYYLCASQVKQE